MAHEARLGYQRRRGDTKGSQESLTTVVVNVSAPLNDPRVAGLWPTPNASGFEAKDPERLQQRRKECKDRTGNGNGFGLTLGQLICLEKAHAASVSLYPTPRASANENRTKKIPPSQLDGRHGLYLSSAVIGVEPAGSSATTENSGALNPAFVCWLMGFRPEWDACAPTATPSSRKSPRK